MKSSTLKTTHFLSISVHFTLSASQWKSKTVLHAEVYHWIERLPAAGQQAHHFKEKFKNYCFFFQFCRILMRFPIYRFLFVHKLCKDSAKNRATWVCANLYLYNIFVPKWINCNAYYKLDIIFWLHILSDSDKLPAIFFYRFFYFCQIKNAHWINN